MHLISLVNALEILTYSRTEPDAAAAIAQYRPSRNDEHCWIAVTLYFSVVKLLQVSVVCFVSSLLICVLGSL